MADGSLYCEHCGEDIHIVPDFDPELEQDIELTISGMLEDIGGQETPKEDERPPRRRKSWRPWAVCGAVLAVMAAVSGLQPCIGIG